MENLVHMMKRCFRHLEHQESVEFNSIDFIASCPHPPPSPNSWVSALPNMRMHFAGMIHFTKFLQAPNKQRHALKFQMGTHDLEIWGFGSSLVYSCFKPPLLMRLSDRQVRSANRPSMQLSSPNCIPDLFAYVIPFRTILGGRQVSAT